MNYLVTGFPGMGKSTIAKELKQRGHIAYDPQKMTSFMHIQDKISGKNIPTPLLLPRGWYSQTAVYNWDAVKTLKLLGTNNDIFICSLAHNQSEFYNQFSKIFVLTLDNAELEHRLNSRSGDSIGKNPNDLADILNLHRHFEQSLLNRGAIRINASQPISKIIENILSHAN